MRFRFFLAFFVLFAAKVFAQNNTILIRTFTTHDSILLRWIPSSPETWRDGIEQGYLIQRFTADEYLDLAGQDPNGKGSLLTQAPIKPIPKTDSAWSQLLRADKLNAFVFDALYSPEKSGSKTVSAEEKMQFGFALKACDLSLETAKAHGLYFCDKTIVPGQAYVYLIRLALNKSVFGIVSTSGELSQLPAPSRPAADFRNKKATLSFDAATTRTAYAGYVIERSEDSIHFTRVNSTLLVFAASESEQNKTVLVYRDSFPQNRKTYWYRIAGYSYFGITGPPSPLVKGKGKDDWLVFPVIDTLYSPDNKRAEIRWHLSDTSAALKSFVVLRAPAVNGPYASVRKEPLAKTVSVIADTAAAFTNYYLVCAISETSDTGFSYPHLLQLADNEPPPVPVILSGFIDTSGIVHLSWNPVSANDLKGYRVFRSNSLREEFYEVSDSVIQTNQFTDTISLQTLTREIFYSVRSVDRMYNNSENSIPFRLLRPDKIPPVPAVVKYAFHTDSTICLGWVNSCSDDLMCAELKRNDGFVVASWNGKDTVSHFTDATVKPGEMYSYTLSLTDSSGNNSVTVFPSVVFLPHVYPPLKNLEGLPDFEKRCIALSWELPAQETDRILIYKAVKGEKLRLWKTTDGKTSSITDRELYPGYVYVYRVKAVLKNGAETRLVEMEVEF